MKKILAGTVLGFLVLVFASHYVFAQTCGCAAGSGRGFSGEGMSMMSPMRHDGMRMMKGEHHLWRSLMSLNLDEKQKETIREIKNRVIKDTIRKKADLEVARIDLKDILHKDSVDMNAAEAMLKKIALLQADIRLSHIKALEEIKTKLTPEQKEKFKEKFKQGPRIGKMKHGCTRMTPSAETKKGASQEKEQ